MKPLTRKKSPNESQRSADSCDATHRRKRVILSGGMSWNILGICGIKHKRMDWYSRHMSFIAKNMQFVANS